MEGQLCPKNYSFLLRTLLNQYGKDNFKPIMKESFNNITHTNNSVTEKLFGDDLQKKIEDISVHTTSFTVGINRF
jgi:hypothetical protein